MLDDGDGRHALLSRVPGERVYRAPPAWFTGRHRLGPAEATEPLYRLEDFLALAHAPTAPIPLPDAPTRPAEPDNSEPSTTQPHTRQRPPERGVPAQRPTRADAGSVSAGRLRLGALGGVDSSERLWLLWRVLQGLRTKKWEDDDA